MKPNFYIDDERERGLTGALSFEQLGYSAWCRNA